MNLCSPREEYSWVKLLGLLNLHSEERSYILSSTTFRAKPYPTFQICQWCLHCILWWGKTVTEAFKVRFIPFPQDCIAVVSQVWLDPKGVLSTFVQINQKLTTQHDQNYSLQGANHRAHTTLCVERVPLRMNRVHDLIITGHQHTIVYSLPVSWCSCASF